MDAIKGLKPKFESLDDFCYQTRHWLSDERDEEVAEIDNLFKELAPSELQDRGLALLKLLIEDVSSGLYGRVIVRFIPKSSGSKPKDEKSHESNEEREPKRTLPTHRFTSGDIVGLFGLPHAFHLPPLCTGVVHQVRRDAIAIAFESTDDSNEQQTDKGSNGFDFAWCGDTMSLALVSSEVTNRRQLAVLDRLQNAVQNKCPAAAIVNCCFGIATPKFDSRPLACLLNDSKAAPTFSGNRDEWRSSLENDLADLSQCNQSSNLNESQSEAVVLSLRSLDVCCIHGPPGTGKTTTLVGCIKQLASQGKRILATAPSNIGVDNLLEKCLSLGLTRCVRLGHPSRVSHNLSQYLFDNQVRSSESYQLCRDIQSEIDSGLRSLRKLKNKKWKGISKEEYQERKNAKRDSAYRLRQLRKELRVREKRAIRQTLESAQIVFATCIGADDRGIQSLVGGSQTSEGMPFDVVCIDEAGQAMEVACWIPALLGRKLIMAGDHCQLPPTIKSSKAAIGLGFTLFERVIGQFGGRVSQMLSIQYRMHQTIMSWSGETFYDSKLKADSSAAERDLRDLIHSNLLAPGLPDIIPSPILWLDTAGIEEAREDNSSGFGEQQASTLWATSKSNKYEAAVVVKYLEHLSQLFDNVDGYVGVITPYSAQVELLRQMILKSSVESLRSVQVATVDGFQGREREVIVMSLVRSNPNHQLGFMSDHRRLNVAVTRAKRHVAIIGDSETIASDEVLNGLFQTALNTGDVVSSNIYVAPEDIPASIKVHRDSQAQQREKRNGPKKTGPARILRTEAERKIEEDANIVMYRKILEKIKTTGGSHTFPSSLTSYHRRIIHAVSEELGLLHQSSGLGNERVITVRNRPSVIIAETEEVMDPPEGPEEVKDSGALSKVLKLNTETRFAALAVSSDGEEPSEVDVPSASVSKKKKKKKKKKSSPPPIQDDDFDEIVGSAISNKWACDVIGCKQSTELLGRMCPFCRARFCLSHALPEVHGCGDDASRSARRKFKEAFQSSYGMSFAEANPSIGNTQWKRDALKLKLDKKMKIAQEARQGPKK